MNRELKFRIYNQRTAAFEYFTVAQLLLNLETANWPFDNSLNKYNEPQQFTGLTDKNGKEIYEGDICKIQMWFGEIWSYCNFPIIFREGCFGYELYEGTGTYQLMSLDGNEEVTGNIHANPELLERQA